MAPISPSTLELFDKVRTVCVGRFLIDIPVNAITVYGRTDAPFEIFRYRNEAKNVDNIIDEYREKIKEVRVRGELAGPSSMLGKVIDGNGRNHQIFFDLSPLSLNRYAMKSFVTLGDDLYVIWGDSYTDIREYAPAISELNAMVALLQTRSESEPPKQAGFCIDGAIVLNAKNPEVERIQFGIRLSELPDIHLSIEMTRKDRRVKSDALEPRLIEAERDAVASGKGDWYRRIKQLRRGKNTLTPWEGYEMLARLPAQDRIGESHQFNFVAIGEPNNEYIPTIDIEMNTGLSKNTRGAVKPSVTDAEALYIWQRLITSLRVRPVSSP